MTCSRSSRYFPRSKDVASSPVSLWRLSRIHLFAESVTDEVLLKIPLGRLRRHRRGIQWDLQKSLRIFMKIYQNIFKLLYYKYKIEFNIHWIYKFPKIDSSTLPPTHFYQSLRGQGRDSSFSASTSISCGAPPSPIQATAMAATSMPGCKMYKEIQKSFT